VELIHYYIPNAKFIHIIRDGRDSAYSWHKASYTIGFGNPNFAGACSDWIKFKNAAKKAKKFTGNYYELHYEDFIKNPAIELSGLFAFCKLNASPELIQSIVQKSTGEGNMVSTPDSSVSYSDRISENTLWKKRLSKKQKYIAKKFLNKDLMEEGYEKNDNWGLGRIWNMLYFLKFFPRSVYNNLKLNRLERTIFPQ
jgi:hypothetical protein